MYETLEDYDDLKDYEGTLHAIDLMFLSLYLSELVIKLFGLGISVYFKENWNR
jgi:hypothetical protein